MCDGEGSKRFVFLSVASFGSLLLFLRKGGENLLRGYMTYLSTENYQDQNAQHYGNLSHKPSTAIQIVKQKQC